MPIYIYFSSMNNTSVAIRKLCKHFNWILENKNALIRNLCEAVIDLVSLRNKFGNRFTQISSWCIFILKDSIVPHAKRLLWSSSMTATIVWSETPENLYDFSNHQHTLLIKVILHQITYLRINSWLNWMWPILK